MPGTQNTRAEFHILLPKNDERIKATNTLIKLDLAILKGEMDAEALQPDCRRARSSVDPLLLEVTFVDFRGQAVSGIVCEKRVSDPNPSPSESGPGGGPI